MDEVSEQAQELYENDPEFRALVDGGAEAGFARLIAIRDAYHAGLMGSADEVEQKRIREVVYPEFLKATQNGFSGSFPDFIIQSRKES